jgi:hypothetical protein
MVILLGSVSYPGVGEVEHNILMGEFKPYFFTSRFFTDKRLGSISVTYSPLPHPLFETSPIVMLIRPAVVAFPPPPRRVNKEAYVQLVTKICTTCNLLGSAQHSLICT